MPACGRKGKTNFYTQLDTIYHSAPEGDLKMITSDFLAKVTQARLGLDRTILGVTNNNNELLVNYVTSNN